MGDLAAEEGDGLVGEVALGAPNHPPLAVERPPLLGAAAVESGITQTPPGGDFGGRTGCAAGASTFAAAAAPMSAYMLRSALSYFVGFANSHVYGE